MFLIMPFAFAEIEISRGKRKKEERKMPNTGRRAPGNSLVLREIKPGWKGG